MTELGDTTGERFAHPALFYRDRDEYLAGTIDFIRQGLAEGEPVAVSVPTGNLALVREALGSDAADVRLLDMTVEGRNPGRIIPGVLRAFADSHPGVRVRIIGEPIWAGRSAFEYPACVQHEALINAAFAGRPATILCPYDVSALPRNVLADAYATHPVVIDHHGESLSTSYDPDRIVENYNLPLSTPPPGATVLTFDGATLAAVRRLAADVGRRAGMSVERVVDLELIIGETTTNSVVHGGGSGVLTLWVDDTHLHCQIRNAGRIADPLAGRLPAPVHALGGRGLLLVNELADLVRLYNAERETTLEIQLPLH